MKNQIKGIIRLLKPILFICLLGIIGNANAFSNKISLIQNPYDGSDLIVTAAETNGSIEFTIKNLGSDMDAPRVYEIIEDDILVRTGSYNLNAADGNETTILINASPGYFTIYVDNHPNHPSELQVIVGIEILAFNIDPALRETQSNPKITFDYDDRLLVRDMEVSPVLYPNPCSDFLVIEIPEVKGDLNKYSILIYNAQGLLILKINEINETQQINTSNFLSGYYYLSICNEHFSPTKTRFIKASN